MQIIAANAIFPPEKVTTSADSIALGPVPSRRLGHSLGINNIPGKSCSYSCVYCQVGPTARPEIERRPFSAPEHVVAEVTARVKRLRSRGEKIDYLTFVPDGEPSLDINLGTSIALLRPLNIPIAVITNGSLLRREDVRRELATADWVSVKVDAVSEQAWRAVNQAAPALKLGEVLDGVRAFAATFTGDLATETLLVDGVNDSAQCIESTAQFIAELKPTVAFIGVPVRPTADAGFRPATTEAFEVARRVFASCIQTVEWLDWPTDTDFGTTGALADDLLGIARVHPMREDEVKALVGKSGGSWATVEHLVSSGKLKIVDHQGRRFFLSPLSSTHTT